MSHATHAPRFSRRRRPGFPGPTKEQKRRWERDAFARRLAPVLDGLRRAGVTGNREIAERLNALGVASESGRPWLLQTVAALRLRLAEMDAMAARYAGRV